MSGRLTILGVVWLCCHLPLGAQDNAYSGDDFETRQQERERLRQERLRKERELNQTLFEELRQELIDPDVQVRLSSLNTIMAMKEVDKDHLIINALEDNAKIIRLSVLDYFIRHPSEEYLKAMVNTVEDIDIDVRQKLVEAVIEYTKDGYDTFDILATIMEDKQVSVRELLIDHISKLPFELFENRRLFDAISPALFDSNLNIRTKTLTLMENFSLDMTHDYLEASLNDPQIKLRELALEIVGEIKDERATKLLIDKMDDNFNHIRARAIELLSDRLDDKVLRLFDNHILNEKDYTIRIRMLEAVSQSRKPFVVSLVSRSLDDPVQEVRIKAAQILKDMQKTIVLDPDQR